MTGMYHIVYLVYTPFQLLGESRLLLLPLYVLARGKRRRSPVGSSTKKNR